MAYQKTRPDLLCCILIINLAILSLLALSTNAFAAKSYQITIVYTNDVHGETDPCG
jgi:2',3'-cyclic-nucleotide 2'-phosphodiesterase (5'-nucleotidase family)